MAINQFKSGDKVTTPKGNGTVVEIHKVNTFIGVSDIVVVNMSSDKNKEDLWSFTADVISLNKDKSAHEKLLELGFILIRENNVYAEYKRIKSVDEYTEEHLTLCFHKIPKNCVIDCQDKEGEKITREFAIIKEDLAKTIVDYLGELK